MKIVEDKRSLVRHVIIDDGTLEVVSTWSCRHIRVVLSVQEVCPIFYIETQPGGQNGESAVRIDLAYKLLGIMQILSCSSLPMWSHLDTSRKFVRFLTSSFDSMSHSEDKSTISEAHDTFT